MELNIFQKGFNYSQDGPGNRLVYHLQGCNLRCPWCSNPEGLAHTGGTVYSIDELVEETQRSRMLFFDGGGVTLTGGEVTMQMEGAKAFLTRLREISVHTCIETNGISRQLPELFPVLDYLIMDIKHYDATLHKDVTGLSNRQTVENIRAYLQTGGPLALRIPLIGGFNASLEDARRFAELLQMPGMEHASVELLPYHEFGKDKYKQLNMEYKMTGQARVSRAHVDAYADVLRQAGLKVIHT